MPESPNQNVRKMRFNQKIKNPHYASIDKSVEEFCFLHRHLKSTSFEEFQSLKPDRYKRHTKRVLYPKNQYQATRAFLTA